MSNKNTTANDRIMNCSWIRMWGVVFFLTVFILVGWEILLRNNGFTSSIRDDPYLWGKVRSESNANGKNSVVIIGASRVQQGIDLETLGKVLNKPKPKQLAISGASPLPVLEDLAEDEDFIGTVIIDVTPRIFFTEEFYKDKNLILHVRKMMSSYKRKKNNGEASYRFIDTAIKNKFQRSLSMASEAASPRKLVKKVFKKEKNLFEHYWILSDRRQVADYSKIDVKGFKRSREILTLEGKNFLFESKDYQKFIIKIKNMVNKIKDRGGQVVFLRMPSSGKLREIEDRVYPRDIYWNLLEKEIQTPMIHFEDFKKLTGYDCPDGSHLSYKDTRNFTKSLAAILKQKVKE